MKISLLASDLTWPTSLSYAELIETVGIHLKVMSPDEEKGGGNVLPLGGGIYIMNLFQNFNTFSYRPPFSQSYNCKHSGKLQARMYDEI